MPPTNIRPGLTFLRPWSLSERMDGQTNVLFPYRQRYLKMIDREAMMCVEEPQQQQQKPKNKTVILKQRAIATSCRNRRRWCVAYVAECDNRPETTHTNTHKTLLAFTTNIRRAWMWCLNKRFCTQFRSAVIAYRIRACSCISFEIALHTKLCVATSMLHMRTRASASPALRNRMYWLDGKGRAERWSTWKYFRTHWMTRAMRWTIALPVVIFTRFNCIKLKHRWTTKFCGQIHTLPIFI